MGECRIRGDRKAEMTSAGYARAAMDEGVDIFETAGNNRFHITRAMKIDGTTAGPLIKLIQTYQSPSSSSLTTKRYIIHKCVTIRHALSGQKMGVDCLSIDGFECKSRWLT